MTDEMEEVLGNLLKENQPQDYIRIIEEENDKLYEQLNQLTNNWNELKEWLIDYRTNIYNPDIYEEGIIDCLDEVLDKMKEIKENNKE